MFYQEDNEWPYRIDVAIEHEKTGSKSYQEIAKLALIHSPLAVLVTYVDIRDQDNILAGYSSILSRLMSWNNLERQKTSWSYSADTIPTRIFQSAMLFHGGTYR